MNQRVCKLIRRAAAKKARQLFEEERASSSAAKAKLVGAEGLRQLNLLKADLLRNMTGTWKQATTNQRAELSRMMKSFLSEPAADESDLQAANDGRDRYAAGLS